VGNYCSVFATATEILGVAPAEQSKYSGTFSCLDGSKAALPPVVNDEFCDCADGSDEPGTGACAGQSATLFYCRNEGSTPRQLYASRVGDGICDCCDGSDEASLASRKPSAKCPNNCVELGKREAEAAKRRMEELHAALGKQEEIRKAALAERKVWADEIRQLEEQLPQLEAALEAAKAAANVEREMAVAAEKARGGTGCRWRQTSACSPTGQREPSMDETCDSEISMGNSGFCDCDGDGVKGAEEPGYDCKSTPGTCEEVCPREGGEPDPAATQPEAAAAAAEVEKVEEKPQVSEYAKWMDGASEALGEGDAEVAGALAGQEKPQVSEYAKWMEGAEANAEAVPAPANQAAAESAQKPSEPDASAAPSAIEEEKKAKKLLDENSAKISTLQAKIDVLPEEYMGYATLAGKTLKKKVSEFTYSVEFFKRANQDSTSLGNWKGWTGPRSATFDGGRACWQGPDRLLNVIFSCGLEEELEDVYEPSRCVYEATVKHPGACDPAELEMLRTGSRVVGPKEEL